MTKTDMDLAAASAAHSCWYNYAWNTGDDKTDPVEKAFKNGFSAGLKWHADNAYAFAPSELHTRLGAFAQILDRISTKINSTEATMQRIGREQDEQYRHLNGMDDTLRRILGYVEGGYVSASLEKTAAVMDQDYEEVYGAAGEQSSAHVMIQLKQDPMLQAMSDEELYGIGPKLNKDVYIAELERRLKRDVEIKAELAAVNADLKADLDRYIDRLTTLEKRISTSVKLMTGAA